MPRERRIQPRDVEGIACGPAAYLVHDTAGSVLWMSAALANHCADLGLDGMPRVGPLLAALRPHAQVVADSELGDPAGRTARLVVLRFNRTASAAELPPVGQAFHSIIGESWQIQEARDLVVRAARSTFPVLITGETGVGKELFARAVHELSPRSGGPFVAVNCAAIPVTLAEAELFGYEEGAFTDAAKTGRAGRFEQAHGGTLFLDEIAEMPQPLQAKLLRALQTSEIERLGGANPVRVDVRIVTATNRDLNTAVKRGDFRADLFYRLNVVGVHVPPLRERCDDVPAFVDHYVTAICRELGMAPRRVTPEILALLQGYAWPGNVREIINILKRIIVGVDPRDITVKVLPPDVAHTLRGVPESTESRRPAPVSRERVIEVLRAAGGNRSEAAKRLGIHRSTLYEALERFGLSRKRAE